MDAATSPTGSNLQVPTGAVNQTVSHVRMRGTDEPWLIPKLTVCNDMDGGFGDNAVGTIAIQQVTLMYPDINEVTRSATTSLVAGCATFSGLDLYVPVDEDAQLDIYVTVSTVAQVGAGLIGQQFRVGMQDLNNTAATFQAIGHFSSEMDTAGTVANQSVVGTFTVYQP